MMAVNLAHFTELCEIWAKLDLFGSESKVRPKLGNAAAIKAAVAAGSAQIPLAYRDSYAAAIMRELESVLGQTKEMSAGEREMIIEQFYAPVYQHGTIAGMVDVRPELRRFLAVVSNLYRSFVNAKKRESLQVPQVKAPTPLAFFQSDGGQGPYTITSESMQKIFNSPVAVVSLPATYRSHGLLWCSLAHEVCGHDVVHADEELVPELVAGVRSLFTGNSFAPNGPLSPNLLSALLWSYWIDEAVADVYGVLNMGPTFSLNLAAFFSAMMSCAMKESGRPVPGMPFLRCNAGPRDPMGGDNHMDEHPVDVLRLYLAIGVIDALPHLSTKVKDEYIADIEAVAKAAVHGNTEIKVQGQVKITHANWRMLDETIPMADAADAARRVGAFLVTTKLKALGNHSIQDVETWDDVDEAAAQDAAARVVANKCLIGAGDDAQLLAGCNIAIFSQPGLYKQMSTLLEEGLNESYNRDPLWGSVKPHLMIAPAVLYDYKASVSNCAPGKAPKAGKAKKGSRGKAVKASKAAKAAKASKASKASKGKASKGKASKATAKASKPARGKASRRA
jgi:hypothetical protein